MTGKLVDISRPLNEEEIAELDAFLLSDATPDDCMDISTLHGFLTALIIGPETIMPSEWIPAIWGGVDEPEFKSKEEMMKPIGYILRLMNGIVHDMQANPDEFVPLFYENSSEGKTYTIIDDWCTGFMTAVSMHLDDWKPLLTAEHQKLINPIFLYGTEKGLEVLAKAEATYGKEIFLEMQKIYVEEIVPAVVKINEFWQPTRKQKVDELVRERDRQTEHGTKAGRNDPCPCGSGKKYKKCCGMLH